MHNILEINDNDIYGKLFNGYYFMECLNKKNLKVKQLVLEKLSDNKNVHRLCNETILSKERNLHNLEQYIFSTHSLFSISNILLKNNKFYKKSDLVHYHQVHNCHFNLPDLFNMFKSKPTILSLHDPWFFTGKCVHPYDCKKWLNGCKKCNNLETFFPFFEDNCSSMWNIKSKIEETDIDIIVHSDFMYELAMKSPYVSKLRIHYVKFGIDMSKFNFTLSKEEAKKKLNIMPNDFVIFMREDNAFKGCKYIVEALKKADLNRNITILTCSGKGYIEELKGKYNVVELGQLEENKVLECYNASDLFLMTSPAESFGMMAVEAMASGVPTVVFDNTALPKSTGAPECGILVKNLDTEDLKEKIKYYVEHPKELLKRGEISKKFVEENYNYKKYIEEIQKVYEEAYEKQKYKNSSINKSNNTIDFNDINVQRLLYRINKLYDSFFYFDDNKRKLSVLKKYLAKEDGLIDYSNTNVLHLISLVNENLYKLLRDNKNQIRTIQKKEQNMPKVSIIIPVYNGENYVSLAIESALRQDYENLEVIVVDDGSKDNTSKICQKYKDRIRYIKKENGGVSTALNLGIKSMTGEYFSWLSHDDLYYKDKISTEIKYLIENDLLNTNTILCSNYSAVDEYGYYWFSTSLNGRFLNKNSILPILLGAVNGLSLLIPKKAFDEVGYFDTNLRAVQDYQLWFDMWKKGYKFTFLQDVLVTTRYHSKSVTNTSPKVKTEGNRFWKEMLESLDKNLQIETFESEYGYWYINYHLHKGDPYDEVLELCKSKYEEIEEKEKKNLDKIKVSVIINASNSLDSLKKSINSVKEQTFKNIEIIVVNNLENTDLEKELKMFDDLKIINLKEIKNNSCAWNEGIKKATGDYIAFLSDSSYFTNTKIYDQLLKIYCAKSKFSFTSYIENGKEMTKIDIPFRFFEIDSFSKEILNINLSTVMVDRNYLIKNNITFNENYCSVENSEDYIFFIDILKNCMPLAINNYSVTSVVNLSNINLKISNVLNYLFETTKLKKDKTLANLSLDDLYNYLDGRLTKDKEKERLTDLKRYEYLISNEYKRISKIRSIKNSLFHKDDSLNIFKSYDDLSHGKLVKFYRGTKKIAKKVMNKK